MISAFRLGPTVRSPRPLVSVPTQNAEIMGSPLVSHLKMKLFEINSPVLEILETRSVRKCVIFCFSFKT